MNVRATRFPLMDSLRAIAALLVVASHAAAFAGVYETSTWLRPYAWELGEAGVTVFFLISGFLLYRPFLRARFADVAAPAPAAYAWRRFLRIVPAYWVALTGVALWLSLDSVWHPAWHIPAFYGFAQIYDARTDPNGIGQAWTLCVEVTFYAFLPLWAWAMRRRGPRGEAIGLAALFAAGAGWKLFASRHADPSALGTSTWFHPLPNFIDMFAVGMALALVSVRGVPARLEPAVRRGWPWFALAAVVYWVLCTRIGLPRAHFGIARFLLRHELATLFAACVLVPAIFAWDAGDGLRRVLAFRPLLFVGLVSYGLYLWHYAVVAKEAQAIKGWALGTEARFAVLCVLGALGGLAIATVSYYLVERPALSLKRLVGPPPERAQPGEALAEPAPASTIAPS